MTTYNADAIEVLSGLDLFAAAQGLCPFFLLKNCFLWAIRR